MKGALHIVVGRLHWCDETVT